MSAEPSPPTVRTDHIPTICAVGLVTVAILAVGGIIVVEAGGGDAPRPLVGVAGMAVGGLVGGLLRQRGLSANGPTLPPGPTIPLSPTVPPGVSAAPRVPVSGASSAP